MNSESDKRRRFNTLAGEFSTDLYRYALWLCNDPAQANDLVPPERKIRLTAL